MDQELPPASTSERDSTLEQIQSLSKEKATDSTREQISKYANFSVSEALGLPLLSGESAPKSWLGLSTTPKGAKPNATGSTVSLFDGSLFDNGGRSYFSWLTDTDKKAIYVAAAVVLLPLLGGFLFSR